jgi:drug/metabolite transporter (DMT)-like permease
VSASEILLIAIATVLIGTADLFGGVASRRSSPFAVAAWSQALGVPVLVFVAAAIGGQLIAEDLGLGLVAGFGASVGVSALYRGFAVSSVGIVAPVAATTAAAVPIVVGVASGEQPSTITAIGLALALAAIFLVGYVPGSRFHALRAISHGLVAGFGFGVMVIAYAATTPDSGLWSAVVGRAGAALFATIAVLVTRSDWRVVHSARLATLLSGVLAAIGMGAFVTVSQTVDLLVLGVALGLFPTVTVLLATVFLQEKLSWSQWLGVGAAGVAVILINVGA